MKTFETIDIESLVQKARGELPRHFPGGVPGELVAVGRLIVRAILEEEILTESLLFEASVHLPRRGKFWVAVFTAVGGGQTWRSTRLTNRQEALLLAKKWEAEAASQRAKLGTPPRKPSIRFRASAGGLTQREVDLLLGISERAVREIERRALRKLFKNLELREIWQRYLAGELDEQDERLSAAEAGALLDLTRTPEEYELVKKLLGITEN